MLRRISDYSDNIISWNTIRVISLTMPLIGISMLALGRKNTIRDLAY